MFRVRYFGCGVALALGLGSMVFADGMAGRAIIQQEREDSLYYQAPAYQPNTREIIHQKAQARAYQRQARLASMNWYGMSNARPMASTTPFTSRYSPTWEMPGGRPFSWHPTFWPGFVVYSR